MCLYDVSKVLSIWSFWWWGSPAKSIVSNELAYIWAKWECPGASPEEGKGGGDMFDTVPWKTLGQLHHFLSGTVLWHRVLGTLQRAFDEPWCPLSSHSCECPIDLIFWGGEPHSWANLHSGGCVFSASDRKFSHAPKILFFGGGNFLQAWQQISLGPWPPPWTHWAWLFCECSPSLIHYFPGLRCFNQFSFFFHFSSLE